MIPVHMKFSYVAIFLLFNLFICASPKAQGPLDGYFKGERVLDMVFSGGFQTANEYYGGEQTFDYSRTLGMAGLFAQYGVNNRFDLVASIPFISDKLQDGAFYAKYK